MVFENGWFLWFLLVIPLLVAYYIHRQNRSHASLKLSTAGFFAESRNTFRHWLRHILFAMRLAVIALVIIVIARPQNVDKWQSSTTEGIDIVLALDVSGSMLARDFSPDRLEASKNVATEFISGRPYDRIGLTVFSGESFTQCPLTTDHAVLINLLREIKSGMIEDGTAIGVGLATAINRIKDSDAISKVIILLTDGVNNMGSIDPMTAAEIAHTFGIRVYTIGVGSRGYADYPVQTPFGMRYQKMQVEIDEVLLKEIAELTGGRYFRAVDNTSLQQVYSEIDKLEKSKIETREHSRREEVFMPWALAAAIILTLELLFRYLFLKNMS
ncbi:MAG: VWA domain-containing protein [Bacteroidales bacterium]|nr:VWA domain-containing protein [Bacteroidales bacterium]MDT8372926.1 VWA domain-containing protein [Bacteroidales bacterium]